MKSEFCFNQHLPQKVDITDSPISSQGVFEFHSSLHGYTPTPLVSLDALANELGVGKIYVKDESKRFGLNAFKALGASYAIHKWMKENPNANVKTFCTATDGNHGRAVAWTAQKLGVKAVIYVPQNTSKARIEAIKSHGAEVVIVNSHYDDTVIRAAADAKENGWQVISDTAYPGYTDIPGYIMSGYSTIFKEEEKSIHDKDECAVDFVFMQAGVGGLAAAGTWYYLNRYANKRPKLVCVEPTDADCLLESIKSKDGAIYQSKGKQDSIMAGLNCGTPSLLAWPIIRQGMDLFMSITDDYAEKAMVTLARPVGSDQKIVSGESGAAGLGGLLCLLSDSSMSKAKTQLGLGKNSRILIISTEGDTDPENYQKILKENM